MSDSTDCNDSSAAVNPNTVWYEDADGDLYSNGDTMSQCAQPADHYLVSALTASSGDCNDNPASGSGINPGAIEICDNGIDENCNPADDSCQLGISNVSVNPSGTVTVKTNVTITTTVVNDGGQTIYYKVWIKGPQTGFLWNVLQGAEWDNTLNQFTWNTSCWEPGVYSISVFISDNDGSFEYNDYDSRGETDAYYDSYYVVTLVP